MVPATVTLGVKPMKINTCTKVSLSKTTKSMPRKLIPLKYFILYWFSILYQFLNFINFIGCLKFLNFLTLILWRAPSNKNLLKLQWLNKHLGRYLEDLRYSPKVLVWKSFGKSFISSKSNVSGLSLETFLTSWS